jgi:chromosomal replication initiator protein
VDKYVDIFVPSTNVNFWEELGESLKGRLREAHYTTWDQQTKFLSFNFNSLRVSVPNKFVKEWIQNNFLDDVAATAKDLSGQECSISVEIDEKHALEHQKALDEKSVDQVAELVPEEVATPSPSSQYYRLNPRYIFENFVVGPSNQFAHAASRAVAANPAKNYNPLFLYGGVGLGKTHLLNAIGQELRQLYPKMRITYISSEQFINKMIHSIRFDRMKEFRHLFRDSSDLLLIDDIQFIAGKERTQEEFFHTFDGLYNGEKQIVLTSDRPPNDIPGLEERLRSRFQWGLIADIQIPDLETRIAILKKKASVASIEVPDDVAHFLAASIKSNIRELEGSLIRISAFASLLGQAITINLAKEVLRSVLKDKQHVINIEAIQKAVATYYSLRLSELLGKRRNRSLAFPRQIAMFLCRKHVKSSYPEIGKSFGGKDHSTVLHAVTKINLSIQKDRELQRQIRQIEERLNI